MRASRLISLLLLLQTHGRLTAAELAARLEISVRTVYRDLDALSAAGVPVYTERGPHGGCELLERYRTTLTGLNEDEVRALFALSLPNLLGDLGVAQTAASARLKLSAALPLPFQQQAQQMGKLIHLDAAGWFHTAEPLDHLPLIQEAIWQQRRLRIDYRLGSGEWVKRLIEPYGLVAKGGIWYLIALNGRNMTTFRVSRIMSAALTDSHFQRDEKFDLVGYWEAASAEFEKHSRRYSVRLRVHPGCEPLLIQAFGEGVHYLLQNEGRYAEAGNCELSLLFGSAEEACLRLLGLGTAVEVIAPAELRRKLLAMAQDVAAMYAGD